MSESIRFSNLKKHAKSNKISFDIQGIDLSVVNSIRRTILSHVECIGFYFAIHDHQTVSDIVVHHNTSPLHNEFLSHRLCLIPLNFNQQEVDTWDDEQYTFVLEKENHENVTVDVTTEHFKILDNRNNKVEMPRSFVKRILPPNRITGDYILLTKLKPRLENPTDTNNKVHITLKAKKGCAKDCICWSIVSECTFFNTVDENKAENALNKKIKHLTDKSSIQDTIKNFNLLEKYRYFYTDSFGEPSKFTFSLETENGLTPKNVFANAIKYLHDTFSMLHSELLSMNKDSMAIVIEISDVSTFVVVSFKNFTHTVGNMLQSHLVNHYVRRLDAEEKHHVKLSYAGYNVPHPLEELFVLKMKFTVEIKVDDVRKFLQRACFEIVQMLNDIQDTWTHFDAS